MTRARGKVRFSRLKCRPNEGEGSVCTPSGRNDGRCGGELEIEYAYAFSTPCVFGAPGFGDDIMAGYELDLGKDSRRVFASDANEGVRERERRLCVALSF